MKNPIVEIKSGKIQGKWVKKEIAIFKGIPFAEPPVGDLRWKPPQPVKKWDGLKKATRFECNSWQQELTIDTFFEALVDGQGWNWFRRFWVKSLVKWLPRPKQSEDCLYLNVKTPSLDPTAKLPVMVWIHGGDHQDGAAADPYYDGIAIPQQDLVFISINYRLGLMGYFAHPELSKESKNGVSGNYGTLDQIAALNWVKENSTSFGGNPDNVTIFGESAGGESVAHMLNSPLAKGLFHKAILQSPANSGQMMHLSQPFLHFDSAENRGLQFVEKVGIKGINQVKQLRDISAEKLMGVLRKQDRLNGFYPVIDGYVLPKSNFERFFEGEQTKVPILLGVNADEGTLIHPIFPVPFIEYRYETLPAENLPRMFYEEFADDAQDLIGLYPGIERRDTKAEIDLLGDSMFGSKALFYAEYAAKSGQPVYFYFFKRVPPSSGQTAGAFHAAELPFVHGVQLPILPLNDEDKKLSKIMIDYWTHFAETGDPNCSNHSEWLKFDPSDPQYMSLDRYSTAMEPVGRLAKYQLLNKRTLRHIQEMKELRNQ